MWTKNLIAFLGNLKEVPGFDFVHDWLVKLDTAHTRATSFKDQVDDAIGDAQDARDAGARLLGLESHQAEAQDGADDDGARTVVRPRPGGRSVAPTGQPTSSSAQAAPKAQLKVVGSGLNPLVQAATELFALAGQLRDTPHHPDVNGLRQRVAEKITEFDQRARNDGVPPEMVLVARYAICTLLDELVLSTPWGSESMWSRPSLLSQFHNETWGGDKFFATLSRVQTESGRFLWLLEFMYLCMALGLEGKYKVLEKNKGELERIRDNAYRTIRQLRGEYERELSPHWRGAETARSRRDKTIPGWALAGFTGLLLLGVYAGFTLGLGTVSEPVYAKLGRIGRDARQLLVVAPVTRTLTLRDILAEDIQAGQVDVIEQNRGSTVEIRGDGLFASGSAEVYSGVIPLLERIAAAMERFPGDILVTGHTDNQPLGVAARVRYPTNWHLSKARAESVARILQGRLSDPSRLRADGRADSEPRAPNETAEGRAKNRRVDVTLIGGAILVEEHPAGEIPGATIPRMR